MYTFGHHRCDTLGVMAHGVILKTALARLLLLLAVVVALGSATRTSSCSRWNCPCSGTSVKRSEGSKRFYRNYHIDAEIARRKTKQILDKLIRERFHDEDHTTLLADCSNIRSPRCTNTHLHPSCNMDGLPTLSTIQSLGGQLVTPHTHSISNFASMARDLLARLAVFVDQARRDEESYTLHQRSLADDIRVLEEQHLYHILCNLHVDFNSFQPAWNNPVSWNLMQNSCRLLNNQAPTDNRNFMIFYTLERLLGDMASQFFRIRHVNN